MKGKKVSSLLLEDSVLENQEEGRGYFSRGYDGELRLGERIEPRLRGRVGTEKDTGLLVPGTRTPSESTTRWPSQKEGNQTKKISTFPEKRRDYLKTQSVSIHEIQGRLEDRKIEKQATQPNDPGQKKNGGGVVRLKKEIHPAGWQPRERGNVSGSCGRGKNSLFSEPSRAKNTEKHGPKLEDEGSSPHF